MKLLLDTHIFLWFISGDSRLSVSFRDTIRNPENDVYLSVVSVWEAIIKYQLGKLPLPESTETYLPKQRARHQIASLPVDEESPVHVVFPKGKESPASLTQKMRSHLTPIRSAIAANTKSG